ncbi:MAG TPA: Bax inhibitor-1/YccA family protein [Gemmatimonadales bacterium]|nr:Bax inhibitor-1/YccA family protein [Gemmatimonadales bacterium]
MTNPNAIPAQAIASDAAIERISAFLRRAYGWMFAGLVVTGLVAGAVAQSPSLLRLLFGNTLVFLALVFAQLGLVVWIGRRIETMSPTTAAAIFLGYAGLTGLVFGGIFTVYTTASLGTTFLVTAGMFGALAVYGTITRRSLQGLGQFAFMGLIGLILASVVSLFWHNDAMEFVITVVGVIVFTALTAYKAQMLKAMALAYEGEQAESMAIFGGLTLYLSFVNLFLTLLRIFGRRK